MLLSVSAVSGGAPETPRILEKATVHSVLLLSHVPASGLYPWPLQSMLSLGQLARFHSDSSYLTGRPGGWVMAFGHFTVTLSRFGERVPSTFPCSNRMPGLDTTGALVLTWYTDRCVALSNAMLALRPPHHSKLVSLSEHPTLTKSSPTFLSHELSMAVGALPSSLIGCGGGGCGSFLTLTLYRALLLSSSTITHGQRTAPILMLAY